MSERCHLKLSLEMSALGAGAPPSSPGIEFLESTCHEALDGQSLVVCGGSFSAKQGLWIFVRLLIIAE